MATTEHLTYERACAEHRWDVPGAYNIAADVCDRHPREKPAMVHEHFDGTVREVSWQSDEGAALVRRDGVPFPPALYVEGALAGYGRLSERAVRRKLVQPGS